MPTRLFHITHVGNLGPILQAGGLLANSQLQRQGTAFQDISYGSIQDRRARRAVPCGAGGYLHDYVPFYFAPRSPMLYAIHCGTVSAYQGGQGAILHLVTTVEAITATNCPYAFTDGHAVMAYADFYDDTDLLEHVVDWEVMRSKYWADTNDDPNRKCKRQAEFLVFEQLPWGLVQEIGVQNRAMQQRVHQVLQTVGDETPVTVYSDWYY